MAMICRFLLLLSVVCAVSGCGGRGDAARKEVRTPVREFPRVTPPSCISSGEEAAEYMRLHYWDRFDFADTLQLAEIDTMKMLAAYAEFAAVQLPGDTAPTDSLMRRASASKPMFLYFGMLAGRVLADPNSPMRNEELYIPVLRAQVASPLLDEWERMVPAHDLELALRNRVGELAADIRYTLASGAVRSLYALQAEYVLLFFSNPGCPMCRELRGEIAASPMLSELIERGALEVVAIYPDEDLDAWRAYRSEMPEGWINGYDAGCVIRETESYDLKAIPSLYLLDRNKRVLVKDSVSVPEIEGVIDRE